MPIEVQPFGPTYTRDESNHRSNIRIMMDMGVHWLLLTYPSEEYPSKYPEYGDNIRNRT